MHILLTELLTYLLILTRVSSTDVGEPKFASSRLASSGLVRTEFGSSGSEVVRT